MDPPNVLWFFGAFAIEAAVYGLIQSIPGNQDGLWRLVAAVGFFVAFALIATALLRRLWWVPGGLAAALAVATFPAVAVGFLQLVDVWPEGGFFDPFSEFSGYGFGVAIATVVVGLIAFALTAFPFLLAVTIGALLAASQLLVPGFTDGVRGDDRAAMALVLAALLVVAGVFLDVFARRRDAFWFHVLGWLSAAAALAWFAFESHEWAWAAMLVVGLALLVIAGPIRRATWASYGVLGAYASVVHYLSDGLNEDRWPFALLLLALGLAIFVTGMMQHRYGKAWAQRFVRRPPPELTP
ncbi:MAG: hypothetical protein ACJ74R_15055 [Gaiellaceae bacterium]